MQAKMSLKVLAVIFILSLAHGAPSSEDKLTIRIVHTNDMHARFEETGIRSGPCKSADRKEGLCYGGFARLATLIRQIRKEGLENDVPTFFLNAGDTYVGTKLFTKHHWKIVVKFLNILKPDAASLGNHEFDDGVDGLLPFLNNADFPVVTANLDLSEEPTMQEAKKLMPSVILNAKNRRIGVVGFLTPDTKHLSAKPSHVIFLDEIQAVKAEAKKLTAQGCDIIIALGHSGYEKDKQIAEEVEEVDLVIGGHTNTFLYNGDKPDIETIKGPYPTVVLQPSGKKVYVVQAYAYTKYLGDLSIDFDNRGEITRIEGLPILVNNKVHKAEDVEAELQPFLEGFNNDLDAETVVGSTKVVLNGGQACRLKECNLGNLAADALISYNARRYEGENEWTDAPIAMFGAGGIRSSITPFNNFHITLEDVYTAFPFSNLFVKTPLTGKKLLQVLEYSVSDSIDLTTTKHGGRFMQVSGIKVTYNIFKPKNSRIVSVKVRCEKCIVPAYEDLNETEIYNVILPKNVFDGGDGFTMFENQPYTLINATAPVILLEHLNNTSTIIAGEEGRITVLMQSN